MTQYTSSDSVNEIHISADEVLIAQNKLLAEAVVALNGADHDGWMPSIEFTDNPDYRKGYERNAKALGRAISEHREAIQLAAQIMGDKE
jgi:hypothetical protein